MALKQASKNGSFGMTPEVGMSVSGYLVGFKVSTGQFGENKNPIIKDKETGAETILNENGNLKYLLDDIRTHGGDVGSYVVITRKPDYKSKKTGKMARSYDVKVDDSDKIAVNTKKDF